MIYLSNYDVGSWDIDEERELNGHLILGKKNYNDYRPQQMKFECLRCGDEFDSPHHFGVYECEQSDLEVEKDD